MTGPRGCGEGAGGLARNEDRSRCKKCPIKAVKTARLATDRPGVLAAVEPNEGDSVREGQLVARLMDEVAKASLDVAKLVADDHVEIQYATKLNAVDTAEYEKGPRGESAAPATPFRDLDMRRAKLDDGDAANCRSTRPSTKWTSTDSRPIRPTRS